jgi:hypothetical protein
VLSLRFWMPWGGTPFERGQIKDVEVGGFGERGVGWLLVSWFEMRSCWRLETVLRLEKF